jgi:hypothetical protein
MAHHRSYTPQSAHHVSQALSDLDLSDRSLAKLLSESSRDVAILRRVVAAIENKDALLFDALQESAALTQRTERHAAFGAGLGCVLGSFAFLMQQEAHVGPVEVNVGLYVGAAAGAIGSVASHVLQHTQEERTLRDHSHFGFAVDRGLLGGGAAGYLFGEVSSHILKYPYGPVTLPVALIAVGWGVGHLTARVKAPYDSHNELDRQAFDALLRIVEQGQNIHKNSAVESWLSSQLPTLQTTLQHYDEQVGLLEERFAYRRVAPMIDSTIAAIDKSYCKQDSYYRRAFHKFVGALVEDLVSQDNSAVHDGMMKALCAPFKDLTAREREVYHRELSKQLLVLLNDSSSHAAC